MEYPLYIKGERRGELSVAQEGLFTVLEIRAEPMEGLWRVSVYGEGRESYLGLLQPWSEGVWLRKKFSRRELAALPGKIDYAAEAGLSAQSHSGGAEPAAKNDAKPAAEPTQKESRGESPPAAEEELLWFTRPDGTLRAFDGEKTIVAIPARLRRKSEGAVLRQINGQEYMLFRY